CAKHLADCGAVELELPLATGELRERGAQPHDRHRSILERITGKTTNGDRTHRHPLKQVLTARARGHRAAIPAPPACRGTAVEEMLRGRGRRRRSTHPTRAARARPRG